MKTKLKKTFKLLGISLLIGFISYGAILDMRFHSTSFIESSSVSFTDEFSPRKTASNDDKESLGDIDYAEDRIAIDYIPYNRDNKSEVDGPWKLVRYIDAANNVYEKDLDVDINLIGTSRVLINNDEREEYLISLSTERGTLALFRQFGEGYEILELKRSVASQPENNSLDVQSNNMASRWSRYRSHDSVYAEMNDQDSANEPLELSIERAYNDTLNQNILRGDLIEGSLTRINDNHFIDLFASVNFGEDKVIIFEISEIKLFNGGQFTAELDGENVSGMITTSGVESYRVKINSGRYSRTVLNFSSAAQLAATEEARREQEFKDELNGVRKEDVRTDEDRKNFNDQFEVAQEGNIHNRMQANRGEGSRYRRSENGLEFNDDFREEFYDENSEEFNESYDQNYQGNQGNQEYQGYNDGDNEGYNVENENNKRNQNKDEEFVNLTPRFEAEGFRLNSNLVKSQKAIISPAKEFRSVASEI